MAITSSSQVLSISKVKAATAHLTLAIEDLKAAKGYIETGIKFSNYDAFHTNQGNPIPEAAKGLITYIEAGISDIETLKSEVEASAQEIYKSEYSQYKEYLDEQEPKRQAKPSNSSGYTSVDRV